MIFLTSWICFNPRLRVGGDSQRPMTATVTQSFNPRLRVGGDFGSGDPDVADKVSIHASAWEATNCRRIMSSLRRVSIHASAWEATRNLCSYTDLATGFNPRLRVGGDRLHWQHGPRSSCFNPRLRVGGDALHETASTNCPKFQSTPPRGRRRMEKLKQLRDRLFQSTPPRGRRPLPGLRVIALSCFNPRLRVGGDGQDRLLGLLGQVSIHASAWEATR